MPPSATLLPPDGTLLGTVVLEGRPSFAMFAQGDGYRTVREGEEITEGALLREVRPDRIVVERGGVRRETLLFPEGLGVALALGGGGPGKASVEWVQSLEGRAERIRARMEQSRRRFRRAVGPLDGSIPGAHGTD